jgi:hypothetical protein
MMVQIAIKKDAILPGGLVELRKKSLQERI